MEAGRKRNRIHRPQYPRGLLVFVLVLAAAGLVMQAVAFAQSEPGWLDGSAGPVRMIGYSLIGIGIMLLMMFADYTVLAQYTYVIYAGYMFFGFLKMVRLWLDVTVITRNSLQENYAMVILFPIVLCGIVYRNRNTGLRGLFRCLAIGLVPLAI